MRRSRRGLMRRVWIMDMEALERVGVGGWLCCAAGLGWVFGGGCM